MKCYTVRVVIPCTVEKNIYINDATSIADAKRKARDWGKGKYDAFDFSGDERPNDNPEKLKILSVEEEVECHYIIKSVNF